MGSWVLNVYPDKRIRAGNFGRFIDVECGRAPNFSRRSFTARLLSSPTCSASDWFEVVVRGSRAGRLELYSGNRQQVAMILCGFRRECVRRCDLKVLMLTSSRHPLLPIEAPVAYVIYPGG